MNSNENWVQANRAMIAKAIGELAYEQVIVPSEVGTGLDKELKDFELKLKSGVNYNFRAWKTVWDFLRVDAGTVERIHVDSHPAMSAAQFFIDAQLDLNMSDVTLANFLEEMYSTLHADEFLIEKTQGIKAEDLAEQDGTKIQAVLSGHPKILLNKGRMGWGASEICAYAPEFDVAIQLHWLAAKKRLTKVAVGADLDTERAYVGCLSEGELSSFQGEIMRVGLDPGDYIFVPVHPWQWSRIIRLQFAGELASRDLISLGTGSARFTPQISLRTLTNISRPGECDIKIPLTILNTSAVRGIPERYIESGVNAADELANLCVSDAFLKRSRTEVLRDRLGISLVHPKFSQIPGAPYRYHETLGAIFRESVDSKLGPDETAVMAGALFHQDQRGHSLIGAYIKKSGLRAEVWLRQYFDHVVVPIYHLQAKYGIGLVAHGQNILVRLKRSVPQGVFLKDFQGDLRLSADQQSTLPKSVVESLEKLPGNYLIHDLLTGHFVTVLRFVSAVLWESDGFEEKEFYKILHASISSYVAEQGVSLAERPHLDLLSENIKRVLLNPVRFKIGYGDLSERPRPMLGTDLKNPIYASVQNG